MSKYVCIDVCVCLMEVIIPIWEFVVRHLQCAAFSGSKGYYVIYAIRVSIKGKQLRDLNIEPVME